jgi:negative regulator of flagellin synthesis FlgM
MVSNINNLGQANAAPVNKKMEQEQVKQQTNQAQAHASKSPKADSVSLTPQAKQLGEMQKKAQDAPVIDQKKIEKLKKAISEGEYKVDPEKLAANIAKFEFKL